MGTEPFAHCVSLGPTCHAAAFLQAHPAKVRRFALPFDWLYSSAAVAASSLVDGCEALLDRSQLEPVGAGGKRASRHRALQAADTKPLFLHHAPASLDADFRYLHRAADRLRRVLGDCQQRALFLHLRVDAKPGAESRATFLSEAEALFVALQLCRPQGNFKLMTVRAVQTAPSRAGGREVLRTAGELGAELVVLELAVRTKSVVPMEGAGPAPDFQAEQADLSELTAAVGAGHTFSPQPLPALNAASRAARATCGPAWLQPTHDDGWAQGDTALLEEAPVGELIWASVQALVPEDTVDRQMQLVEAVWASGHGPLLARKRLAQIPATVADWATVVVAAPGFRQRDWKQAGRRLKLPLAKASSDADLVARVLRYQLQCSE